MSLRSITKLDVPYLATICICRLELNPFVDGVDGSFGGAQLHYAKRAGLEARASFS